MNIETNSTINQFINTNYSENIALNQSSVDNIQHDRDEYQIQQYNVPIESMNFSETSSDEQEREIF